MIIDIRSGDFSSYNAGYYQPINEKAVAKNIMVNLNGNIQMLPESLMSDREGFWFFDGQVYYQEGAA